MHFPQPRLFEVQAWSLGTFDKAMETMAMKVESPSGRRVTVADTVRSFAKGVIGERIAVRKLEQLMAAKYIEWYEGNGPEGVHTKADAAERIVMEASEQMGCTIHTDNL